jgi:acyl-CoA synthetase (AMP-forming)/AMP-acid ligase II
VLILTTGSTGASKGTRQLWARLIRAVRQPDDAPGTRWLLAYNLNQFAGVQLLLHVLVSRATLVAPPSSHARDVLDTMRADATTHVSATPTVWRLLVAGLDPSTAAGIPLVQITLGGEATPADLLQRLGELFPSARISHVYAGTEFGSAVSVGDGLPGLPVSVLDRPADADVRLRVVDGELQVRSRIGMVGYLEGDDADDEHWHATGDLVEERDGRLHFVGRTTEIINVGGAKVHPLPIEELVRTVDGVEAVAVYGRKSPITGQIVALDVVLSDGADQETVDAAIRETTLALPAPGRPRRIRFVPELQTRGNKLVRRQQEPSS